MTSTCHWGHQRCFVNVAKLPTPQSHIVAIASISVGRCLRISRGTRAHPVGHMLMLPSSALPPSPLPLFRTSVERVWHGLCTTHLQTQECKKQMPVASMYLGLGVTPSPPSWQQNGTARRAELGANVLQQLKSPGR